MMVDVIALLIDIAIAIVLGAFVATPIVLGIIYFKTRRAIKKIPDKFKKEDKDDRKSTRSNNTDTPDEGTGGDSIIEDTDGQYQLQEQPDTEGVLVSEDDLGLDDNSEPRKDSETITLTEPPGL